ncbi:MAG: DUF4124 domain-containing protein [Zoogloeaceae bacterium]|jgi:hypothetical protein|nr:DUF4124 domain-containing protein [Zoogloeaceae bacterium]
MKKILLLLVLGAISGGIHAEVYKCLEKGRLTISTSSCPSGAVSTAVTPEPEIDPATRAASAEALARLQAQTERMAHERHEREAADAATRKEAAQAAQREAERRAQEEAAPERERGIVVYGWSHANRSFYPPPGKAPRYQDRERSGVKTGVKNSLNSNPGSRNRPVVQRP